MRLRSKHFETKSEINFVLDFSTRPRKLGALYMGRSSSVVYLIPLATLLENIPENKFHEENAPSGLGDW